MLWDCGGIRLAQVKPIIPYVVGPTGFEVSLSLVLAVAVEGEGGLVGTSLTQMRQRQVRDFI